MGGLVYRFCLKKILSNAILSIYDILVPMLGISNIVNLNMLNHITILQSQKNTLDK